mmetsp:Transcript_32763/g.77225  ORF Transcript_32763/g.77225 Transcript_32763/m.77225 type:complete len:162 (-) Transcript_32763:297-782(-)
MSTKMREQEKKIFGSSTGGGGGSASAQGAAPYDGPERQGDGESGFFASIVEKGFGLANTMVENTKALVSSMSEDKKTKDTPSEEGGYTWADFKEQYLKPMKPAADIAIDSAFHVKQFITTELPESGQETIEFLFKDGGPGGKPEPPREVKVKDIENKWNFV